MILKRMDMIVMSKEMLEHLESCVQCHHIDMRRKRCGHPDFAGDKFSGDWVKIWTEFDIFKGCPLLDKKNEL